MPGRGAAALALLGVLMAACSTGPRTTPDARPPASSTSASSSADDTVWLCRPGLADDPCTSDLTTTVVDARGARSVQHAAVAPEPPIDCFYVYPTVSRDPGPNADLTVDPEERAAAMTQAARFSSVCRVWAPMYAQLTTAALSGRDGPVTSAEAATAYRGLEDAWQDYLTHDNRGRGVVLIGHSQGAFLLDALIRRVIDGQPAARRLLVSALLLGGNVEVPLGGAVGGDFQHVPACTEPTQTGCVVAYSTFVGEPPVDAVFGRPNTSIGALIGVVPHRRAGMRVLCTNPAALAGGAAALHSYLPTTATFGVLGAAAGLPRATTPWVAYPGRYSARCEQRDGASWLDVTPHSPDVRPRVRAFLSPQWGLHLYDVNIALGDLVTLVARQARAYGP